MEGDRSEVDRRLHDAVHRMAVRRQEEVSDLMGHYAAQYDRRLRLMVSCFRHDAIAKHASPPGFSGCAAGDVSAVGGGFWSIFDEKNDVGLKARLRCDAGRNRYRIACPGDLDARHF